MSREPAKLRPTKNRMTVWPSLRPLPLFHYAVHSACIIPLKRTGWEAIAQPVCCGSRNPGIGSRDDEMGPFKGPTPASDA